MLKKVGIFLGRQILKVGFFWGIKYEPLSDPPVIKICEWGPWGGEAMFCPLWLSLSLEIQSTPLGLSPCFHSFVFTSQRPSCYLWSLILYQHFCMVDIERFSDRYREKQTDEGLDWQPGNISVLVIYCIIILSDLERCCSTEHVLETNPSLRK